MYQSFACIFNKIWGNVYIRFYTKNVPKNFAYVIVILIVVIYLERIYAKN